MPKLKKYNLEGKEAGELSVDDSWLIEEINSQSIKNYIVALRANLRQWSANTKGRSEVQHSNQKPHKQKGLGRARQGSLAAPQYKGGGIVFGPKPKFDQNIRINKKERRRALRFLFSEKMRSGSCHLLADFELEEPKTKVFAQFINALGLEKRVLFLGEEGALALEDGSRISVHTDAHNVLSRSLANLPKARFTLLRTVSAYDLLRVKDLVLTEPALQDLLQWLS